MTKLIPDLKGFTSRRYGKIQITYDMYEIFWKQYPLNVVPLSLEFKPHRDVIELECFCDAFRELGESDAIPEYEIIFKRIHDYVFVEEIKEVGA